MTRINGRTGFIEYSNGSLFFSTKNFIGRAENIREKSKVIFIITKSFDQKKQRETLEANYITIDYGK